MELKEHLDELVEQFNSPDFIEEDPISVPHRFRQKQDREIAGFIAAIFAWGQRKTIINKATEFIQLMDDDPYNFIVNHKEIDRKSFEDFRHRTFQPIDALYILEYLQRYYRNNQSLETAFLAKANSGVKDGLVQFHELFFSLPTAPHRTKKHISTPANRSTCKRLNMFLRWMVRKDDKGVDFGIWNNIDASQLMIPLDVHVERVARSFKLLKRKQRDWLAVEELTNSLREFDANDPVKYDYALFGLGVISKGKI